MNSNNPFFTSNLNCNNTSFKSPTVPTYGRNVTWSPNLFGTEQRPTTPQQATCSCNSTNQQAPATFIRGEPHVIIGGNGGVLFTFGPENHHSIQTSPPFNANVTGFFSPNTNTQQGQANIFTSTPISHPQPQSRNFEPQTMVGSNLPPPPLTLEQQIVLKELEKNGLESLLIQERLKKNPFKLQFHYDGQTSTDEIYFPDFQSKCGSRWNKTLTLAEKSEQTSLIDANEDNLQNAAVGNSCQCPSLYSDARKLKLPENHPDLQPQEDVLKITEPQKEKSQKKEVTFSFDDKKCQAEPPPTLHLRVSFDSIVSDSGSDEELRNRKCKCRICRDPTTESE